MTFSIYLLYIITMSNAKNLKLVDFNSVNGNKYSYKYFRKNLGLTQKEVAEKTDITVLAYNLIENQKLNPSSITAIRIEKILGINKKINEPSYYLLNQIISCNEIFFHPEQGIDEHNIDLVIKFRELCMNYYQSLSNDDFIKRENDKFIIQTELGNLIKELNHNKIKYSSYLQEEGKVILFISISNLSDNTNRNEIEEFVEANEFQCDENNEPIFNDDGKIINSYDDIK